MANWLIWGAVPNTDHHLEISSWAISPGFRMARRRRRKSVTHWACFLLNLGCSASARLFWGSVTVWIEKLWCCHCGCAAWMQSRIFSFPAVFTHTFTSFFSYICAGACSWCAVSVLIKYFLLPWTVNNVNGVKTLTQVQEPRPHHL